MISLYAAILFLCLALALFFLAGWQKRKLGLPAGKVVYIDTTRWGKVDKPLYDPELRLTGKPDYLVEQGSQIMPVEVKARQAPQVPFESHIYQLAAYCLLVKHAYGVRPTQGFIHYNDRTFAIEFTAGLEVSVKEIIIQMQSVTAKSRVDRSHNQAGICLHCGYRLVCDQTVRI